tara:strand:- start:11775 stop:12002 length:228 start_codon:yes stop_codon:yes gene_type:complete
MDIIKKYTAIFFGELTIVDACILRGSSTIEVMAEDEMLETLKSEGDIPNNCRFYATEYGRFTAGCDVFELKLTCS